MIDPLSQMGGALFANELAVLAYGLAAMAAFWALRHSWRAELGWALCVIALGALAINQQFGLLDALTNLVRGLALQEAWYGDRNPVQRELIIGIGLASLAAALILLIGLRRQVWQVRLAILATVGLLALAVVKAISLHQLDALFARTLWPPMPLTLGGGLALVGVGIVLFASLMVPRYDRPDGRSHR